MLESSEPFTKSELVAAFRLVMSEEDAREMAALFAESGAGAADYTLDTLLLLSLYSHEFDSRVRSLYGALRTGPGADSVCWDEWEKRRVLLQKSLEERDNRR